MDRILTRSLGQVDYASSLEAMRKFTAQRGADSADELWRCEHPPVFTLGLAGKREHLIAPGSIPIIASDRGGQVTYHGPGQVVIYTLLDLKRAGYYVKEMVFRLEEACIKTLGVFGVTGHRVAGAPGVYVRVDDPYSHAALQGPMPKDQPFHGLAKIAALGIKVSRHCSYHGLALNVAMDLEPFSRINPCGYAGLQTTDLSTIGVAVAREEASTVLASKLTTYLAP